MRKIYPKRNILDIPLTPMQSQNCLKKSDGFVLIVDELYNDEMVAGFIQAIQISSSFAVFGHPASTTVDLIKALSNSLVSCSACKSIVVAERQIADCININIHLAHTSDGDPHIDRVTEIIPLHASNLTYMTRDLARYDSETNTYQLLNWISDKLDERIRQYYKEDVVVLQELVDNWK